VALDDKGSVYNQDLVEAVELGFLLDLAEVTVAAAAFRTESRGCHFRSDHPARDDRNWLKHSLTRRNSDGSIDMSSKPVTITSYQPMERKY